MTDERVRAAIENWAPRFTSQGVDYNDFTRTTARIERWDDWCTEWSLTGDEHAALALQAQAQGRTISAGEAFIAAALCYHFGKFLFQDHPDEYREAGRSSIAAFAQGLKLLDPSGERVEIPFDGATMVATLRRPRLVRGERPRLARDERPRLARDERPDGVDRPPLAVLLPGLDSTKEEFFYWEEVFLKRGMATLSLDGPGQGECGYQTKIRPDYEAAITAVMDWLETRKDIDAGRVGLAGVSLGGYYAARAAAFEPRVRAAVAICGPWNFGECWAGMNALSRQAFADHSGALDLEDARARACQLTLAEAAARIEQPLLVIQGRLDRLIPWQQAEKIVSAVGENAELVMFENGNHVCNNIPYLYRPLTADWLKEHL